MSEQIILVDEYDNPIGECEKLKAHQEGALHRAFSLFIFNSKKHLLLQKRSKAKYHSAGLWSNTCCSHPRVGESLSEAVNRRLKEEMGFSCGLKEIFSFIYKVELNDFKMYEHELDHVFIGQFDGRALIDTSEVEDYTWIDRKTLLRAMELNSEKYTYWFKISIQSVLEFV